MDSFNLPIFFSPMKVVKEILERNEYFSLERMEALKSENFYAFPNVHSYVSFYRAVTQDLIEKHFGGAIVDELFNHFSQKVVEFPDLIDISKHKMVVLFVFLKRKL